MQTISLSGYYNKICCPFCKKLILPSTEGGWDSDKNVCKHLLYIYSNDPEFYFLSKEVKAQLKEKGYNLTMIENLLKEDEFNNSYDVFDLSEIVEYPNAFEFDLDFGDMNGISFFVAFSPSLSEV
jgi:hypothetical protein